MVDARGIVVFATGGVGQGVVGVVYELKFTGSFFSFGGVGCYSIRVGFECCSRRWY